MAETVRLQEARSLPRALPAAGMLSLVLLVGAGASRPAAQGGFAGGEIPVNESTLGHQNAPAVARGADGGFVVVWQSYPASPFDADIFMRRFDASGSALRSDFRVNVFTTGYQRHPAVASDASGAFVVVWESLKQDGSLRGIFGRRFDSSGNPLDPNDFRVNTYTTGDQIRPDIAMSSDGEFTVVWEDLGLDGSFDGVFGQHFDSAGNLRGGEFQVNTYTTAWQGLAAVGKADYPLGGSKFIVVWTSGSNHADTLIGPVLSETTEQDGSEFGVFTRYGYASGSFGSGEALVNQFTLGYQGRPRIAVSSGGSFIVVWQSGKLEPGLRDRMDGISGRWGDTPWALPGAEFRANSYTTGLQRSPDVAMDPNGERFVVVWTSYGEDGDLSGIVGRRFKPSPGESRVEPLGCGFPVNEHTLGAQSSPRVAMTGDCGFVTVWTDGTQNADGQDGSAGGIFARLGGRFDLTCRSRERAYCCPWPEPMSLPEIDPSCCGGSPPAGTQCPNWAALFMPDGCCPDPSPMLACPVRWAGVRGAPSVDCPESLCASRFEPGDYHTMLNERHARASDSTWAPRAGIVITTAPASGKHLTVPDQDYVVEAGGSEPRGALGDVRIAAFDGICTAGDIGKACNSNSDCDLAGASGRCALDTVCRTGNQGRTGCTTDADCDLGIVAGTCVHPELESCEEEISGVFQELKVCSAFDCTADANCGGSLGSCFIPTGAPAGTSGKCKCPGGTCGAGLGSCVPAYEPLGNGCISKELRDTWVCADCQWHQAAGAPDCDHLGLPNCPARDPSIDEPQWILAVSANNVLETHYLPAAHSGRAVIGSPTYPWLIVPDPQVTCGSCDDQCTSNEAELAHELGHVFSNYDDYPLDPCKARAYLDPDTGLAGSACSVVMSAAEYYEMSDTVPGGRPDMRMDYFAEMIGDTLPRGPRPLPYLDIEKVLFTIGPVPTDSRVPGLPLSIHIGLAGMLPPWRGRHTFEISLDTDSTRGCMKRRQAVPGQACFFEGEDHVIVVEVEYDEAESRKGYPAFRVQPLVTSFDEKSQSFDVVKLDSNLISSSANIVYLERHGRSSDGEAPDKLPIRSEIHVKLADPEQALELPRGWESLRHGWRVMAVSRDTDDEVADLGPDEPATLTFSSTPKAVIHFPARVVPGEDYLLVAERMPPSSPLRIELGGRDLDGGAVTGPNGVARIRLGIPRDFPLGRTTLRVRASGGGEKSEATSDVLVTRRGEASSGSAPP